MAIRLTPVIGERGVDALFRRTLHITSRVFPCFAIEDKEQNGLALLISLKTRMALSDAVIVVKASHALLVNFTVLLATLIGESLTKRLLEPVWVLPEACRQTLAWLKAGLNMGQVAVNVSAVEFHGNNFLSGVLAILNETGLGPHFLEMELTESGLMQDTEKTTTVLRALKNLGAQIAIDDFGTGYSSLSYLRRFPIDTLKIDRSFVLDIDEDTEEAAIVSAVVAMGKSLKLRVVAEGIETQQQYTFLQSLHCAEEGQGYYFSRPVAAEVFADLLKS